MRDISRDAGAGHGRTWWATVLTVVLLHGAGLAILAGWAGRYFDPLDERCPWYDDEGTMAAPRSLQGRVVCGDSGVSGTYWLVVVGVMAVALLAALAFWLCRRTTLAVVAVLLAGLVPAGLAEASLRLEDSCSAAQWKQYGKAGCEQDRELR
ncbi:hypothetical protein ACFFOS_20415 [Nocardioides kongjuensis]|uniref:Uncharacterized protein n=1 Tax=Nocardioides kongjuensis TaxID=349522 RepID=A0A852R9Z3_9ACTN|nr:hypothetical protein [Nocardioides kongjuensis]NYD31753.1 hypothetical protein [Nocardioides kongjuensis]